MRIAQIRFVPIVTAGLVLAFGGCSDRAEDCNYLHTCAGSSGNAGTAGAGGSSGKGGTGGSAGSSNGGSVGDGGGGAGDSGAAGEGGMGGAGGEEPCGGKCGGETPICKEATDTCVECLETDDCSGSSDTPFCDTGSNTCVECLMNSDCTDPTASRCNGGACAPCDASAQCAHISGMTICDVPEGECVECTVDDESACGVNSCNPANNQCTSTPRGSVGECKPCLADSECTGGDQPDPDFRCIPMTFMTVPRPGGFCLRRAAKTCGQPYTIGISAVSLSGAPAENYCGIDQQNVRCEAVLDLIDARTCPGAVDTLCGCARDEDGICTETGQGGLCRDFAVLNDQCTYACGTANDCPLGKVCAGSPTKYCQ